MPRIHAALLFFMAGCLPIAAQSAEVAQCATCHDQGPKLVKSSHAALSCDTCHASHEKYPHPANVPLPDCGTCHQTQAEDNGASVHGQARTRGNASAPDCAKCHGDAHELVSPKTTAFRT